MDSRNNIPVTKPFMPPKEEYLELLTGIWDRNWLTNNGPLAVKLEEELKSFLNVDNLLLVSNGTVALQLAIKALHITGEVITTPFSYVATTSAILWENCQPIFVDINPSDFCIDVNKIEAAITKNTQAIIATHVFGYPCDVEAISKIADKHNLKVIYDAAHAFGTQIEGKSILNYGDISICSFHATKLFHTVEGGCLVASNNQLTKHLKLKRQFGHEGDTHYELGINGKNSEFHAAMGICNLRYIDNILNKRKEQWCYYKNKFKELTTIRLLSLPNSKEYNYAYFPIVLANEQQLLKILKIVKNKGIYPRRYFYPSLNTLPYLEKSNACPIAESIANRVLCLPLFHELREKEQKIIIDTIYEELTTMIS